MSSRLLKLPVVLALMVSIGLHWAFLQSVAWVGMVVSYSQTDSLSIALEKTFDGQHPCRLCHFVKDGQQQEHAEVDPGREQLQALLRFKKGDGKHGGPGQSQALLTSWRPRMVAKYRSSRSPSASSKPSPGSSSL